MVQSGLFVAFADLVDNHLCEAFSIELRQVHLAAHLRMITILTADQIAEYNVLRGYATSDPCANVPPGHDESLWMKHNGCAGD